MVYVRKYKKRSTMRKSRKGIRRTARRFNIAKPYQTKFVRLTRWSALDQNSNVHSLISGVAGGSAILGSTVFKLSNTSGYGEIQNLFDNYCIRRVMYRWVLYKDPNSTTSSNGSAIYPRLTWVHDFNDSTPISRLQMQQHPRMREFFFGDNNQKTRWYSLKPASLAILTEGLTTNSYKPTWGSFVDTNDYDMPHYGIKYAVSQLFESNYIYLEAKIVIDAKGIS